MANPGAIKAVCTIPAATKWAYAPYQVYRDLPAEGAAVVLTGNAYSVEFRSPPRRGLEAA